MVPRAGLTRWIYSERFRILSWQITTRLGLTGNATNGCWNKWVLWQPWTAAKFEKAQVDILWSHTQDRRWYSWKRHYCRSNSRWKKGRKTTVPLFGERTAKTGWACRRTQQLDWHLMDLNGQRLFIMPKHDTWLDSTLWVHCTAWWTCVHTQILMRSYINFLLIFDFIQY